MASQIKPIGGLERIRLADAVPLDTPFSLYIFPTTFCNFRCVYCAHSQTPEELEAQYHFKKETMDMDTFHRVLEQLKGFPRRLKVISLTGHGEPLLNVHLPEMVREVKEAGVAERVEVISNGSLLTHDLSDRLIGAGLDILRISLQGVSAQRYQETCGYDLDFEAYIGNLEYYYQKKKPEQQLFVKVIDVALGEGEEEKFYQLFEPISDRMYVEYCQRVYEGVELTKHMEFHSTNRYGQTFPKQEVCAMSFFMMGVYPDGSVIPCDVIYKPVILGNVHEDDLVRMWNGEKRYQFHINQLKNGRATNPECARCVTPDDILRPEDILDDDREMILHRMERAHAGGGVAE